MIKPILPRSLSAFFLLACVLALASCASISVEKGKEVAVAKMPLKVYVAPFETAQADFKVDRESAELTAFKSDLQGMLQTGMTTDLTRRLIPAFPAKTNQHFRLENAWLIQGQFTRVNQGSRLLRGAIGFGAGGTKVETKVQVYDLNKETKVPFLTFITTGGSGAEPGAVASLATDPVTMAVEMAASSGGGIAHGLTEDTARTAREITAVLSDYMYRSGWIPKDKWIEPKNLSK